LEQDALVKMGKRLGKGEGGKTAKPDGTANPTKKFRRDKKTGRWKYIDPHTGQPKLKPPGFEP